MGAAGPEAARPVRGARRGRDGRMPLQEHVRELRNRLLLAVAGLVVGAVAGWAWYPQLIAVLQAPVIALDDQVALNFTRVHNVASTIDSNKHPISARNALFREATYFRSADFYLHGNWSDPRINSLWDRQLAAFDSAIALLSVPGERIVVRADGFEIPAVFFRTGLPGRRPTIIMCNGFDGSQEEMYHSIGEAVLQRGMNVITFEGPGQPIVRRRQGLGFIPDWERVVSPLVDHALTRHEVDPHRIGLLGLSFGGYLAPRAAAFDRRIAAVIAFGGIYSFTEGIHEQLGPEAVALYRSGNATAFNDAVDYVLAQPSTPTSVIWGIQQGLWSFGAETPFEWVTMIQNYTLEGLVDKISAPVFVGDAENEKFFPGQAKLLADKLGQGRATYRLFESIDGAGEHCSLGASVFSNQVILDWFEDTVGWESGTQIGH